MANTSIGGLVSGLDTTSIISQLMQLEARPQLNLKNRVSSEQREINALQTLNSKLAGIATKAAELAKLANWSPMKASSDNDKVSVTAASAATPTTLTFNVNATATASKAVFSTTGTKTAVVGPVNAAVTVTRGDGTYSTFNTGDGSLTSIAAAINDPANATGLQATLVRAGGPDSDPTYQLHVVSTVTGVSSGFSLGATFLGGVVTTGGSSSGYIADAGSITIPAPPDATFTIHFVDGTSAPMNYNNASSLSDAAAKINASNAGVTASLVGPAGAQRLHLVSKDGRAFNIQQTGSVASPFTAANSSGGTDAKITINGTALTSSSNTFDELMPGVDVTLAAGATGTATITVAKDTASLSDKVKGLVDAVNVALDEIASLTKSGADVKSRGMLAGDSTLRTVRSQLIETVTRGVDGTSLATYGIQTDKAGKLVFDAAKFKSAYDADPAGTAAKFAGTATWSGTGTAALNGATWRTAAGSYTVSSSGNTIHGLVATRSGDLLTGAAASPVEGMTLKVSADASGTVTYKQGLAAKLEALSQSFSDSSSGIVTEKIKSGQKQIKGWEDDIADWDVRLAAREAVLQKQYTALESALGKLQSQGSWLAGQIASLPRMSSAN